MSSQPEGWQQMDGSRCTRGRSQNPRTHLLAICSVCALTLYQLATSPPLCLDPDPRLGKIANSLYRISLPRTPPPLRPKKRKASGLGSIEGDEASVNRKTKIIRFMDPKPTRSATP